MKNPPHPGEVIREDVFAEIGLSVSEAARRLGVSRVALSRVLNGRAAVSAELAVRLERAGLSKAKFWLDMQSYYDLAKAMERATPDVERIVVSAT